MRSFKGKYLGLLNIVTVLFKCFLLFTAVLVKAIIFFQNVQLAPLAYSGYYVSSTTQFSQDNTPANGYPASTWPLYPVQERIAQTYGTILLQLQHNATSDHL